MKCQRLDDSEQVAADVCVPGSADGCPVGSSAWP